MANDGVEEYETGRPKGGDTPRDLHYALPCTQKQQVRKVAMNNPKKEQASFRLRLQIMDLGNGECLNSAKATQVHKVAMNHPKKKQASETHTHDSKNRDTA